MPRNVVAGEFTKVVQPLENILATAPDSTASAFAGSATTV